MERYLVTGGAGFIGGRLTARLAERGAEIVVVDNLSRGDESRIRGLAGVELVRADVRELRGTSLGRFTHVFHLAALISASESFERPDDYYATNVGGLLRLMEASGDLARPPRFVFASTAGVYGSSESPLKRESDPERPTSVYAATKLAGEQLLAMYRARLGLDDVTLRLFNVYGPGGNPKLGHANVVTRFAAAAVRAESVQVYGDGTQTRDFVYVDDVVDAVVAVAFAGTRRRVYNVGTGRAVSVNELLSSIQRLAGGELRVERHAPRPNEIHEIHADVSDFQQDFGFAVQTELENGLGRTIAAFVQPSTSARSLAQSP